MGFQQCTKLFKSMKWDAYSVGSFIQFCTWMTRYALR